MQEIQIERTKNPKQKPTDQSKLGFGKIFTDHMYIMPYNKEQGWHDPKIVPYQHYLGTLLHGVPLWPGDVRGPEGL